MEFRTIHQIIHIRASPEEVYKALMDSAIHTEFTGSPAEISLEIDGEYATYDGYISGTNLELEPGKKIVQTWSPVEDDWPKGHVSEIEIDLAPGADGTTLSFTHRNLPSDKADTFAEAWYDYYWEPLKEYFDADASGIIHLPT